MDTIIVTDNGSGMEPEDCTKCFLPHHTSKLSGIDELDSIGTHGFRGEALSSIAAVSTLGIKSKTKHHDTGRYITIKKGVVEKDIPFGMPIGTQISVRNIFSEIPARKKFLKSKRVEYLHILEMVLSFAMAYPQISFTFINKRKRISYFHPESRLSRIGNIIGKEKADQLIPIMQQSAYFSIEGYFGTPQLASASTHKQYIFVNNRRVYDKGITSIIKDAYGAHFDSTYHPVYVLFITVSGDMVDINVHPRKEEVRLYHKQQLVSGIKEIVASTLEKNVRAYQSPWNKVWISSTQSYAGQMLKDEKLSWQLPMVPTGQKCVQIHELYIVFEIQEGVVFVDQHAGHERILFEQFLASFKQKKKSLPILSLPKSYVFTTGIVEESLLQTFIPRLRTLGFTIEPYKKHEYVLSTVPELFRDRDYAGLIEELLVHFREGKNDSVDTYTRKMITFLACRSAVKAGTVLSTKQMEELVIQLEKLPNNTTCPHGRPTKIFFEKRALDRMFRR